MNENLNDLVEKFDNDPELVEKFVNDGGYPPDDLRKSNIKHPTDKDPLVELEDGTVAGMWID